MPGTCNDAIWLQRCSQQASTGLRHHGGDGGGELGRQRAGKEEHGAAVRELILNSCAEQRCTMPSLLGMSSTAPVKGTHTGSLWTGIFCLLSTSLLNLIHSNKMWPGYCPFFSLFPEDCWLVPCSCQPLLSWLAQLYLLLVRRTALKSSHKEGFSDDVWSCL